MSVRPVVAGRSPVTLQSGGVLGVTTCGSDAPRAPELRVSAARPPLFSRRDASRPSGRSARGTEAEPAAVRPVHGAPGAERRQPAHATPAAPGQAGPRWPPRHGPAAGTAVPTAATDRRATGKGATAQRSGPRAPRWPASCTHAAHTAPSAHARAWEGADAGPAAAVPATGTLRPRALSPRRGGR